MKREYRLKSFRFDLGNDIATAGDDFYFAAYSELVERCAFRLWNLQSNGVVRPEICCLIDIRIHP